MLKVDQNQLPSPTKSYQTDNALLFQQKTRRRKPSHNKASSDFTKWYTDMSYYNEVARVLVCILMVRSHVVESFLISPDTSHPIRPACTIYMADIRVSQPTPQTAAEAGIREWPQQTKSGQWQEFCEEGEMISRYVLEGFGHLDIREEDGNTKPFSIRPGTLIEVSGQASLTWETSTKEMIILTPSFEEGCLFAAVAFAALVLFGSLVAFS